MRPFSLLTGCLVWLCAAFPCAGTTITFSDLRQDAAMGVHVHPTGPDNLPVVLGGWDVYGSTVAFENNTIYSRFYSGTARFDQPVSEVAFDVERLNNSGWRIPFTVVAYNNKKRVAIQTIEVDPLGDKSQLVISAPSINQIAWTGGGWIFHPYILRDFQVTFTPTAPSVSGADPPPVVGTPVPLPEPGAVGFFGFVSAGALLRRRPRIV